MKEAKHTILASFAPCAYEDYPYKPSRSPWEFVSYVSTLDKKAIVMLILHALFYPDHELSSENVRNTIYPFESALAKFVYIMMKHI